MSRIGKKSVLLPEKVKLDISQSGDVTVEGPKGKLEWTLPRQIKLRVEGKEVRLERSEEARSIRALHGLSRSLVQNMVTGVSEGYQKELEIHGVGFRAQVQGKNLNLNLGYSHPVVFNIRRLPRTFGLIIRPNRTKVRGFATSVSKSCEKKEKRFNRQPRAIRWRLLIELESGISGFASGCWVPANDHA